MTLICPDCHKSASGMIFVKEVDKVTLKLCDYHADRRFDESGFPLTMEG